MKTRIISLVLAVLLSVPALADNAKSADRRVGRLLDEIGLSYRLSSSNDYIIPFPKISVWVNSNTSTFRSVTIREVWAGFHTDGTLSRAQLENLLVDNGSVKLSGWTADKDNRDRDSTWVCYVIRVDADCSENTLKGAIYFAREKAEELMDEVGELKD